MSYGSTVSGGATTNWGHGTRLECNLSSSVTTGYGRVYASLAGLHHNVAYGSSLDVSLCGFGFDCNFCWFTVPNNNAYVTFCGVSSSSVPVSATIKGFGFSRTGTGTVKIVYKTNSSEYTEIDTGFTPSNTIVYGFSFKLINGTITWVINGTGLSGTINAGFTNEILSTIVSQNSVTSGPGGVTSLIYNYNTTYYIF